MQPKRLWLVFDILWCSEPAKMELAGKICFSSAEPAWRWWHWGFFLRADYEHQLKSSPNSRTSSWTCEDKSLHSIPWKCENVPKVSKGRIIKQWLNSPSNQVSVSPARIVILAHHAKCPRGLSGHHSLRQGYHPRWNPLKSWRPASPHWNPWIVSRLLDVPRGVGTELGSFLWRSFKGGYSKGITNRSNLLVQS